MKNKGKYMHSACNSTENISITIKSDLLTFLDEYCAIHELQRSQVVGKAVKMLLAVEYSAQPSFWREYYNKLGT